MTGKIDGPRSSEGVRRGITALWCGARLPVARLSAPLTLVSLSPPRSASGRAPRAAPAPLARRRRRRERCRDAAPLSVRLSNMAVVGCVRLTDYSGTRPPERVGSRAPDRATADWEFFAQSTVAKKPNDEQQRETESASAHGGRRRRRRAGPGVRLRGVVRSGSCRRAASSHMKRCSVSPSPSPSSRSPLSQSPPPTRRTKQARLQRPPASPIVHRGGLHRERCTLLLVLDLAPPAPALALRTAAARDCPPLGREPLRRRRPSGRRRRPAIVVLAGRLSVLGLGLAVACAQGRRGRAPQRSRGGRDPSERGEAGRGAPSLSLPPSPLSASSPSSPSSIAPSLHPSSSYSYSSSSSSSIATKSPSSPSPSPSCTGERGGGAGRGRGGGRDGARADGRGGGRVEWRGAGVGWEALRLRRPPLLLCLRLRLLCVERALVLSHREVVDVAVGALLEPREQLALDRPVEQRRLLRLGLAPRLAHLHLRRGEGGRRRLSLPQPSRCTVGDAGGAPSCALAPAWAVA